MISYYSSFVELVAALYFTMCLDDVLKNVWTRPGYERINSYLRKNHRGLGKARTDYLVNIIKTWNERNQSASKKMAFFMLLLSAITLAICGYEESLGDSGMANIVDSTWAALASGSVFVLIIGWKFLKARWYKVIIYSLLCMLVFLAFPIFKFSICIPFSPFILLLFLSLPIALFLLKTFLYTCFYLRYLVFSVRKENDTLKTASTYAFKCVIGETDGPMPSLPLEYGIAIDEYLKSDLSIPTEEESLNQDVQVLSPSVILNTVFLTRLRQLFDQPSVWKMLRHIPKVLVCWRSVDDLLPVNEYLSDYSAELPIDPR